MRKVKPPRLDTNGKILLRRGSGEEHVGPAFKWALAQEQEKGKARHSWYKNISPSGLTLDLCMETYFANIEKYLEFNLATLMKVSFGIGMHAHLGRIFKHNNSSILYPAPTVTLEEDEKVKAKRASMWPEVLFHHPVYHVRGKADLVPCVKRKPVIIDFKTTWMEDKAWEEFLAKPLLKPMWLGQLCSYGFIANDLEYYDQPVERLGIICINMKRDPDKSDSWKEIYFDYEPYAQRTKDLFDALLRAYDQYVAKEKVVCTNPGCKAHGTRSKGGLILLPTSTKRNARQPESPFEPEEYTLINSRVIAARKKAEEQRLCQ